MASKVMGAGARVIRTNCEKCLLEDLTLEERDSLTDSVLTNLDQLNIFENEYLDDSDSEADTTLIQKIQENARLEARFSSLSRKQAGSASLPCRVKIPYCPPKKTITRHVQGSKTRKMELSTNQTKRHQTPDGKSTSSSLSTSSLLKKESIKPKRFTSLRKLPTLSDPYDITEILLLEADTNDLYSTTKQNQAQSMSDSETNRITSSIQDVNPYDDQLTQLDEQLSAWAKWLIKKESVKRKMKKKQREKQIKQLEEKYQKMNLKVERQEKANRKWKEWLQHKEKLIKQQKEAEEARKHQEEIRKQQLQFLKIQKSKAKFEEWCQRKTQEEIEKQNLQKQLEENQNRLHQSRAQAALLAYTRWLNESRRKSPLPRYSKGYADGKLIDYYDRTANPPPSFVNPNPWKNIIEPVEVDSSGSRKRK